MAILPKTNALLQRPDRRRFLWSAAALGLTAKIGLSEKRSEPVYRFLTPVCEVRMSVEYFASSSIKSFRFRDDLTNRTFCLSASRKKDRSCLERFVGSMAIAQYHFRSRLRSVTPLNLRERVLTIDHDSRISPRAPFERVLTVERAVVSDIQAFGYKADDAEQATRNAELPAMWYLVRQDLYMNDQATAFLIVHWKHTLNFISLLDVNPREHRRRTTPPGARGEAGAGRVRIGNPLRKWRQVT
jgi:hypothetical protein